LFLSCIVHQGISIRKSVWTGLSEEVNKVSKMHDP
jgi:hypothetical protein